MTMKVTFKVVAAFYFFQILQNGLELWEKI